MKGFPTAQAVGVLILVVGVTASGLAAAASQTAPDKVSAMVDTIFANAPTGDQRAMVFRDDRERVYLAFYISTYADVRELRAYSVTFRNVREFAEERDAIDTLLDAGNHAEAFDALIGLIRLDLGSQYVSDVSLDGVHEGEVAVGQGHMRDRFHNQVFADHATANAAYMAWLERAVILSES